MTTHDADPWADLASPPDWSAESRIRTDFTDPSKTIPASWAQDMVMRWHQRNPSNFGNELAKTVIRWQANKLGSEES